VSCVFQICASNSHCKLAARAALKEHEHASISGLSDRGMSQCALQFPYASFYLNPPNEDSSERGYRRLGNCCTDKSMSLAWLPVLFISTSIHTQNNMIQFCYLNHAEHVWQTRVQGQHGVVRNNVTRHSKGCSCRKSHCLKKYCECFQAGIFCGHTCRCKDCRNFEGSAALASVLVVPNGTGNSRSPAGMVRMSTWSWLSQRFQDGLVHGWSFYNPPGFLKADFGRQLFFAPNTLFLLHTMFELSPEPVIYMPASSQARAFHTLHPNADCYSSLSTMNGPSYSLQNAGDLMSIERPSQPPEC
jgi:hypothetical protein